MSRSRDVLNFNSPGWGLSNALSASKRVLERSELLKPLMQALFSDNPSLRHRASDTARRIAERRPELLAPYTERLLGLFSASADDNWRMRAHLGLVVARVAQSRAQRLRAAGLLMSLYYDPSNVVRCTAIEGLGLLALREPSLRRQVEPLIEEALLTGTLAMKDRARHALAKWASI